MFGACRFRLTALAFCEFDIAVAFASGTHFGHFLPEEFAVFSATLLILAIVFFLAPVSTLFHLAYHLVNPPCFIDGTQLGTIRPFFLSIPS
jgi:hypothetical protein